jgi:hypothetical protein
MINREWVRLAGRSLFKGIIPNGVGTLKEEFASPKAIPIAAVMGNSYFFNSQQKSEISA